MGIYKKLLEMSMTVLGPLAPLRAHAGSRLTQGLDDASVERLAVAHPDLAGAIAAAASEYTRIKDEAADLLDLDEKDQIDAMQAGFVNFYAEDAINPYVAVDLGGGWKAGLCAYRWRMLVWRLTTPGVRALFTLCLRARRVQI